MNTVEQLRACPFCRCKNVNLIQPSLGRSRVTVVCDDCCAEGPSVPNFNSEDPEYLAALAWNTRFADAKQAEVQS